MAPIPALVVAFEEPTSGFELGHAAVEVAWRKLDSEMASVTTPPKSILVLFKARQLSPLRFGQTIRDVDTMPKLWIIRPKHQISRRLIEGHRRNWWHSSTAEICEAIVVAGVDDGARFGVPIGYWPALAQLEAH
jgi:hypothetical protein